MAAASPGRRHLTLRVSAKDLETIDRLAKQQGLTRTDYVIRASTGDLEDPYSAEEQLVAFESRLLKLERITSGLG